MTGLPASISFAFDAGLLLVIAVFTPDPWEAARRILTVIGFLRLMYSLWKVRRKRKHMRRNRKS